MMTSEKLEESQALKALQEDRETKTPSTLDVINSLVVSIKKFWKKYEVGFVEYWHSLDTPSREKFLQEVYPTLPYSLAERYSIQNGVKINARQYDRYLLLRDRMTVSNLAKGDLLIDMMNACSSPEFLSCESTEIVVKLRELHQQRLYPFKPEEREKYNRELNIKRGDFMYSNMVADEGSVKNFGSYIKINDPVTLVNGTGTLGPDGSRISFYRWGLFAHPTEQDHMLEYMYFELSLLVNAIDEYKEEVLGKRSDILLQKTTSCANCVSEETKLLMCGGCNMVFYCSKACQTSHWKTGHKAKCKAFCELRDKT